MVQYLQQWYVPVRTFAVKGTTWIFVYKELAICSCAAAAKWTRISLKFYCFLMINCCFIRHFM